MKLWYYQPRSAPPEIHVSKETILEDMKDDLWWAQNEDPDDNGGQWEVSDDRIFVDDGGRAELVEVVGMDRIAALVDEYRPSMPEDALREWALELVQELERR